MKLLAIETSTDRCSCAIALDGECRAYDRHAPRQHAELILEMISELLQESDLRLRDLNGVAFGRGPGSFTGVRIAASVTQGLAYGADLPVVGISSLQALAQGVRRGRGKTHVLTAFDARMSEVYWGAYREEDEIMAPVIEDGVFAPQKVPIPASSVPWHGAGDGWSAYADILAQRLPETAAQSCMVIYPSAIDIITLASAAFEKGQTVSALMALPVYLRDTVTRRRSD